MRLSVEKITDISTAYTVRLGADELNEQYGSVEPAMPDPFTGEARVDFQLSRIEDRLLLDGEASADLTLQCGRCLERFAEHLQSPFFLALTLVTEEPEEDEELELEEEQINSIILHAGEVDLGAVLQEQLLMRVSSHAICEDDCAGLCLHCGENLNKTKCNCEPKPFDNRFGKLKGLKLNRS